MREIKFRGKRKDTGEWVYGCYTINFTLSSQYLEAGPYIEWIDGDTLHSEEVIPETVGEYTNLEDKNGVALNWWEGDKFRIDGHVYTIVFDKGCIWFDGIDMPYRYTADSVAKRKNGNVPKVIGNIHEEKL